MTKGYSKTQILDNLPSYEKEGTNADGLKVFFGRSRFSNKLLLEVAAEDWDDKTDSDIGDYGLFLYKDTKGFVVAEDRYSNGFYKVYTEAPKDDEELFSIACQIYTGYLHFLQKRILDYVEESRPMVQEIKNRVPLQDVLSETDRWCAYAKYSREYGFKESDDLSPYVNLLEEADILYCEFYKKLSEDKITGKVHSAQAPGNPIKSFEIPCKKSKCWSIKVAELPEMLDKILEEVETDLKKALEDITKKPKTV